MSKSLALLALLTLAGCHPAPPAATAPAIAITDAWARATAPGQSSAAVYATIASSGGGDSLVAVSSSLGSAMLHGNQGEGGIARMRMVGSVAIPAGGTAVLAPGGTHVMLSGLRSPLVAGTHFPLTLRFAGSGEHKVEVAVVAAGAR